MLNPVTRARAFALWIVWAASCASAPAPGPAPAAPYARAEPAEGGRVDRAAVEALPKWQQARARAVADPQDARALLGVPAGATVRIYLGTWCGDSRREVSRFWKALDLAGGTPPFEVDLIAVDRSLAAPDGLTDGARLAYVPTFIVIRGNQEVGRIVESPESSIERDLAALLRGERTGVVSGRR